MNGNNMITLKNVVKTFNVGKANELEILHNLNLEVDDGDFVAIVGASGSGKTTLMNIIGVLDRPTEGKYTLDGIDISELDDTELSEIRNNKIGFVFQNFNLIPRLSALKNVELPMAYGGMHRKDRENKAKELLEMVGMANRGKHMPNELSGGEKQRVAIARAMANNPAIILADEPTGALDSKTSRLVLDMFHTLHKKQNKTIIVITHSAEIAQECKTVITLKDGEIIDLKRGGAVK
jgi:putative ABC transport system ATP-binding protein